MSKACQAKARQAKPATNPPLPRAPLRADWAARERAWTILRPEELAARFGTIRGTPGPAPSPRAP